MKIRIVYSIRFLLIVNFFVMSLLCFINLMTSSKGNDFSDFLINKQQNQMEEIIKKVETLKQSLKNKYPLSSNFVERNYNKELPMIYAITPTYARWTQKADLTRLSQTLLHVSYFHWIVVEDSKHKTTLVINFLKTCGIKYTHLNALTAHEYKLKNHDPNWLLPRGVAQRNIGLKWIRENVKPIEKAVLYFMDDDNTYALKSFEEMRFTNKLSAWPVGLSGALKFEGPGKCEYGHVLEWYTAWKPERPFPIDMAGFAVNINLVFEFNEVWFSNSVSRGYQESSFLTGLKLSITDAESKANECKEVLVWHTRTEKPAMKQENKLIGLGKPSNPDIEV